MLKTTANIVASKNVARGAGPLLATLHPKIAIADMLQDPKAWPAGTGMYSTQRLGDDILRDDHFWLEPISIREPAEVVGLKVSVQGLEFMFFAFPPDKMQSAFPHALYRPGSITFVHPRNRNRIELSWVDRVAHGPIELTFRSTAGDLLAAGAPLPPNNIRRRDQFR